MLASLVTPCLKRMGEVTGHTFRRSGMKQLAKKNMPLPWIQFFVRHSSSAVLAYVEEAYEESSDGNLYVLNHLEIRDQIAALSGKTNDMIVPTTNSRPNMKNWRKSAAFR